MSDPYIRKAVVKRIVDGDTIVVDVDLGFSTTLQQVVRLAGINAPEVVGADKAAGLASKAWLENLIPPGTTVTVQTVKPREKYGRYLATVLIDGLYVHDLIVAAGHAVRT